MKSASRMSNHEPKTDRGSRIENQESRIALHAMTLSSILDPRSSILDPRSSILDPRRFSPYYQKTPRSSILDPRRFSPYYQNIPRKQKQLTNPDQRKDRQ